MLSERQEKILNILIEEYINSAQPVSSKFLSKNYDFEICPASIRIEMQRLTDAGFIFQPHTSAGRVPTDKGYRFFVDSLFNYKSTEQDFFLEIEELFLREDEVSSVRMLQELTRSLAACSSNLIFGYLFNQKISYKEGWAGIIKEPEFSQKENINNFIETIEFFEKEITSPKEGIDSDFPIEVFIGNENNFAKAKEFSIIVTSCYFPEKEKSSKKVEKGIMAIFGPKRMNYNKNIASLNYLIKNLNESSKQTNK